MSEDRIDEGLQGNEKIEEAIAGLRQEPTQEMLAHTLTVLRRSGAGQPGWENESAGSENPGRQQLVGCVYKFR